jgi:hypothetical protein
MGERIISENDTVYVQVAYKYKTFVDQQEEEQKKKKKKRYGYYK